MASTLAAADATVIAVLDREREPVEGEYTSVGVGMSVGGWKSERKEVAVVEVDLQRNCINRYKQKKVWSLHSDGLLIVIPTRQKRRKKREKSLVWQFTRMKVVFPVLSVFTLLPATLERDE